MGTKQPLLSVAYSKIFIKIFYLIKIAKCEALNNFQRTKLESLKTPETFFLWQWIKLNPIDSEKEFARE